MNKLSKPTAATPLYDLKQIKCALQLQLMFVTLLALGTVFFFDINSARAVFMGALVAWLSQAVFAWSVFKYAGARANAAIVRSLFRGQFLKWTVCFIGFMVIFNLYKPDKPKFVLIGFTILVVSNWGYAMVGRKQVNS